MKRKIISLLLCLVMALSLIPTVAFGVDGEATDPLTTNGFYTDNGWKAGEDGTITTTDGLTLSKTATYLSENTYRIDLKVVTTQTTTTVTTSSDAATVLVIDCSGSMAWCTQNHKHTEDCYSEKVECTPDSNKSHWVIIGPIKYHIQDTPCHYDRKNHTYYTANCGQTEHTHDWASGGQWCGGTGDPRITSAKDAAMAFIDRYKDSSAKRWVAVVSFAGDAASSGWFNVSTKEGYTGAETFINNLTARGGTNLDAGLSAANSLMAADDVTGIVKDNKNVIALTDGVPTQSANYGNGQYGSSQINDETASTATTLKGTVNALYTICFAASGETCYQEGPTVDKFLENSIASSGKASTVDEGTTLPIEFATISNTITSGLTGEGGWTVNDPMAENITVVKGTTPENFTLTDAATKTYTWTLNNPTVEENGSDKVYTYTTSYNVTIDPNGKDAEGNPLKENSFYPTNEKTTLHYIDANNVEQTADFPVPGVKVKLGSLTITKTVEGLTAEQLAKMEFSFTVTGPNNYSQTVKMTANDQWTKTLTGLTPGEYTVTENEESAKVEGYVLTAQNAKTVTVSADKTAPATVNFINTYKEESTPPAEVSVEISVTKNVTISRGSKEPAETLFTFEASVGDQKFTLPLIPKKAENWTATGMLRVSIPYELFKDDVATVTIKEIPGGDTRWKYDTKEYTVFVYQDGTYEVKSENPEIAARATADQAQEPTALTFTNEYNYKYTPTPKPTTPAKPVTSVKTGDMGVALYAGLAILSMTGSAGVILRRRKNDK